MQTLADVPAAELPELVDLLVWDCSHQGEPAVRTWLAELEGRPDAGAAPVLSAVAVCREYLGG